MADTPPKILQAPTTPLWYHVTIYAVLGLALGLGVAFFLVSKDTLAADGVTEVPRYRITPDYTAKKQDTDTWQDGRNGGLLGISDLLLRAQVMATYLFDDWGRDWGSLRKFDTIVDAEPAQLELGSATRSGLWKPGQIRIKA